MNHLQHYLTKLAEAETAARKFRAAHGFTDTHGRAV